MRTDGPFLATDDAARLICKVKADGTPNREALRRYLKRYQVRCVKAGRRTLVHRGSLLDSLTPTGSCRR